MNFENEFTDLPARHSMAEVTTCENADFESFHYVRRGSRRRKAE